MTERFRRPQFAGRLGLRCGVSPRQTQSNDIASRYPRLVGKNPTTASGPPPLIKGGEWLPCEGELSAKMTERFRRPQFAGRLGLRCGVSPRQTQSNDIASRYPRLVGKNPTTASGPPPLIKGGEWLPCEGELSAKLTEGFLQRPVSHIPKLVNVAWFCEQRPAACGLRTAGAFGAHHA